MEVKKKKQQQRRKEEKNKLTYKHEKNLIFHISLSTNFLEEWTSVRACAHPPARPMNTEKIMQTTEKRISAKQNVVRAQH